MNAKKDVVKKAVVSAAKPKTVQPTAPETAVAKAVVKTKIVLHPKVQTAEGWKRGAIKARTKGNKA